MASLPSMLDMLPPGVGADEIAAFVDGLPIEQLQQFNTVTKYWWRGGLARPEQLMPAGRWSNWLLQAGRGFGKNRSASEAIKELEQANPFCRIAIIGPTMRDVRDTIVEGESGILSVYPDNERPLFESSKHRLTFKSGAIGLCYSAEEPERLRGPQHHFAYGDEIATYPKPEELYDNLKFGLRLGDDPRAIFTTTPKPIPFLRKLIADEYTVVTRGSTWANRANLPESALREFERVYAGTRIGRQELEGELLEEAEGALWRRVQLDHLRVRVAPILKRVVVAVDPATTSKEGSDEWGIVAAGLGENDEGYLLGDSSAKLPPDQAGKRVVDLFDLVKADRIVVETNQGGDMVKSILHTVRPNLPLTLIHASRGKVVRAEPIAALYEQSKVHHVGTFTTLEDELVNWVPGVELKRSPNRADALVYAFSDLMLKPLKKGLVGTA